MAKRRKDATKSGPLFARRSPPPVPPRPGGWGKRQRFVKMLQRHPDEWYQYEPGAKHSPAAGANMKSTFPGLRVTIRKRRAGGGHNIYCMWPSEPDTVDEMEGRWAPAEMVLEDELDPEPEDFDWSDFQ